MYKRILLLLLSSILASHSFAALVDTQSQGDKVYFLYSAPNKISIYDISSEQFEADISLDSVPTAFFVEEQSIYIAYHRTLEEINKSDLTESFIRNFSTDISKIFSTRDYLFAVEDSSNVHSLDKIDFELIETRDSSYSGSHFVASDSNDAYYYRTSGVSPSDIHMVKLNEDGTTISDKDSPYHGDYPSASKLFINQTQNKIYDNSGISYFATDLTYAGSLAGSLDALCFKEDNPIVARENKLHLFTSSNIEQGELDLIHSPIHLTCSENKVFSFSTSAEGITVEVSDISAFSLPDAGEASDPTKITFTPEKIELDELGNLYLLDIESLSIFTWSSEDDAYSASWPLLNPPTWMTYSSAHKRLYLGYSNGKITFFQVDSEDEITEQHLTSLPTSIKGLKSVDQYLFATDSSGAWNTHYLINSDGSIQSSVDWRHIASEYAYSPLTSRVYHHRDGTSPNDLEWSEFDQATGVFGSKGDSPYHGDTLITRTPLRVNLAGDIILNGAGQLLDAYDLSLLNSLANNISDATWLANGIVTLDEAGTTLQFWNSNYQLSTEYPLQNANKARIFQHNNELLLIQYTDTRPSISIFSPDDLPDSDNDGINDFNDNCVNEANEDQIDTDSDRAGNACDLDDDSDGLPDTFEIQYLLDPLDSSDAGYDLDSDGFSNFVEYVLGTNINDAESIPQKLSDYSEDFEGDWPLGFFSDSHGINWQLSTSEFVSGEQSLRSATGITPDINSSVSFTAYFDTGIASVKLMNEYDYYYYIDFQIYIDDALVKTVSGSSSSDWRTVSVAISEGVHTIRFESSTDYTLPNGTSTYFYIDDFKIEADNDSDGIGNSNDNCPDISNAYQWDNDNDGIGNECDINPNNQDQDNDGWGDNLDNCPLIANPGQENEDNDYYGDACDDTNNASDSDYDGIMDTYDNCQYIYNPDQIDSDYNGYGDACDERNAELNTPLKTTNASPLGLGRIPWSLIFILSLILLPRRRMK